MFTYEVSDNPPMCRIISNESVIDESGPWESVESAQTWAEAYTNKLNSGIIKPEEPS
jgi:hypothetical protein